MPDNTYIILCSYEADGTFHDNIKGKCADCEAAIVWRPHVPAHFLKLCGLCALVRMAKEPPEGFEVYEGQRKELEGLAAKEPHSTGSEFIRKLLQRTRKH